MKQYKFVIILFTVMTCALQSNVNAQVTLTDKPGWPINVSRDAEFPITFFDINHDGNLEILSLYGVIPGPLFLAAIDIAGNILWTNPGEPSAGVAATDFLVDGNPFTIIAYTTETATGLDLHVVDENGADLAGWPISLTNGTINYSSSASPVIDDLDQDGVPEVLFSIKKSPQLSTDDEVIAYFINAVRFNQTAMTVTDVLEAPPSIAEFNVAGQMQKVITAFAHDKLYAWNINGSIKTGFPIDMEGSGNLINNGPAVVSRPNIGSVIVQPIIENKLVSEGGVQKLKMGKIELINLRGQPVIEPFYLLSKDNPEPFDGLQLMTTPAIGYLDNDRKPDIVVLASFYFENGGQNNWPMRLFAFNLRGNPLQGFEGGILLTDNLGPSNFPRSAVISDIDGQPGAEILVTAHVFNSLENSGHLYSVDSQGNIILDKNLNKSGINKSTPAVGKDELGDTLIGLTVGDFPVAFSNGSINLWTTNTRFQPDNTYWPQYKKNAENTGLLK